MVDESYWRWLLAALVRWRSLYWGEGERFAIGPSVGNLWSSISPVHVVVAQAGVPVELLKVRLPGDSLEALSMTEPEKFSDTLALSRQPPARPSRALRACYSTRA
jgi:hypothetical protein